MISEYHYHTTVAGHSCGSQASQWGRSIDYFLPWWLAEHLLVLWKLVFPSPSSKVCGVFSNSVLSSTSGRYPRTAAIAYMFLDTLVPRLR